MKPYQLSQYQQALHLEDRHLGFFLGLRIDESQKLIPAMKTGKIPIEDWMQPELMKWLTLFQQEFQTLQALHQEGKPYAPLPSNAIRDDKFYERVIFYRPDLNPDEEIGEWPARLELSQQQEHLRALQGAVILVNFDTDKDIEACIGLYRYALFEHWRGGYNNFVHYAAGELRAQNIPYLRIDYSCAYNLVAELSQFKVEFLESIDQDEGEVIPLFPETDTTVYNADKTPLTEELRQEEESWKQYISQRKTEAAKLAPVFDGLL